MPRSKSDGKDRNVWSLMTLEALVGAIATLGDRIDQLRSETWRLNERTRSSGSLWSAVIENLELENNENIRHSLYNIWRAERYDLVNLVKNKRKATDRTQINEVDDAIDEIVGNSVLSAIDSSMPLDPSLPLPERPNTRAYANENIADDKMTNANTNTLSLVLTLHEWKSVFSRTHQKMKKDWADVFYKKLTLSAIQCPVNFKSPYIKKGKRKQACQFFCCQAQCAISMCSRRYRISLQDQPGDNCSALFLVNISGEENHDRHVETSSRQLRGKHRLDIGEKFW